MTAPPEVAIEVEFLDRLNWIDGNLLCVEPYRRRLFADFFAREPADPARFRFNCGVFGRSKKNNKTTDSIYVALTALVFPSPGGSDVILVANDEDQAGNALDLAKKVVRANPVLSDLLSIQKTKIVRRDGGGTLEIVAAGFAISLHGRTFRLFVGDEIHGWRTWDVLEACALDPTRPDAQMWLTSYASMWHKPGAPLYDLMKIGRAGTDPRMLFSWYAADYCTDPDFAAKSPEERANPSMASWNNPGYLAQQQRRLPAHKYRRLHLNLPGLPEGSAFQPEPVMDAIARGIAVRPPAPGVTYAAFVDMSGGSSDDAVLAIGHRDAAGRAVLDTIVDQGARPPFDPNAAVDRFVRTLQSYRVSSVAGDRYAGETFRRQFEGQNIAYAIAEASKHELYEALEPALNGHRVEFVDVAELEQQLLGLVWRGGKIDHPNGEHDDYANAAAGVVQRLLAGVGDWPSLEAIDTASRATDDEDDGDPAGFRDADGRRLERITNYGKPL